MNKQRKALKIFFKSFKSKHFINSQIIIKDSQAFNYKSPQIFILPVFTFCDVGKHFVHRRGKIVAT